MKFLDQTNRILTVAIVGDADLTARLVIERFTGSDYLSRDFHYDVLLLSEDDGISLGDVQGRMMVVQLKLPDGTQRPFTGLVKYFELVDADMRGICSYRAQLVPWTDYATLHSNCRIHLNTTRREQFEAVLRAYGPVADWRWAVLGDPRTYTMCVQFNETDRNYLDYRLELDGTPYRFEHRADGHTLVVFDTTCRGDPIQGVSPEVRFHPDRSTSIQQYAITQWSRHAQWGHGTHRVSSYDFKRAAPVSRTARSHEFAAHLVALESHEFIGNYGFIDANDGDRLARLRMEEADVRRRQMQGHSTNPYLQPGRWFCLTEHPDCSSSAVDNEYVVSEVHYEAKNNYLLDAEAPPSFKNTFLCNPRMVPWRPGRGWASTPNIVATVQTATVVSATSGGTGAVDVDEYGRVLVRFHWDLDGKSTCRVRLQMPWAGGEKGFAFYPRVGSEVVIAFEMGNPDSPVVQGCLANASRMPAWKLPSQSNLSGIRSRENTEGGNGPGLNGSHLLFDDTPGRLQWQAFNSHLYSQVSLGFLSHVDGTSGRTRARGQGLEVRTDGHSAWRAARGILQTTDARNDALGHVTDIREAAERLSNAQDLHQSLADAAQAAGAQDANDQAPVVQALQQQTRELKGSGGNPEQGEFPEFRAPHILTSSAAGIESVAEGSTHLVSNEHLALTSGGHTSISAGKSLLASAKGAVRLFAYQAGMKLVSASADIDLQALKTSIHLLAKLNVTLTADSIDISAKTRLSLSGGGSNITLEAGKINEQTSGSWVVHAASYDMTGPASVGSPPLPQARALPLGQVDVLRQYVNQSTQRAAQGVKQNPVTLLDADGGSHAATLDGKGFTSFGGVPMGMVVATFERNPRDPWDAGSYLGEDAWHAEAAGGAGPAQPTLAAAVAALAAKAPDGLKAVDGAKAAAAHLGSQAQGALGALAGQAAGAATAALGALTRNPATQALMQKASGALGAAQALKQLPAGGAGALFAPRPPRALGEPERAPPPTPPGQLPVMPASLTDILR